MERILLLQPDHVEIGLRALKAVAMADGRFDLAEKNLLEHAAKALAQPLGLTVDIENLPAITPAAAATAVRDELTRTRIIQAQMVMALIDGDADAAELRVLRAFADAFDVAEPRLKNMRQLVDHHHTLLKLDLNRHSRMARDAVTHAYRERGLKGVWETLTPFMGKSLGLDPALAWRYRQLGLLPEDTFGRQYWAHMVARRFGFPGEPGAFSEEFIKHDCCHTLGGYDTDPAGECQVVAFICGFMRADPFWYLFMVLVHMHLGIETFPQDERGQGAFDPALVITALDRGARVTEDLYAPGFDWWSLFDQPIADVRATYGIRA